MSLQQYLQRINNWADPGKIFVESVRSVLQTSRDKAKIYCEMAVRDDVFKKVIGIECPNCKKILKEYDSLENIPKKISCEICEADDKQVYEWDISELPKLFYYKLK